MKRIGSVPTLVRILSTIHPCTWSYDQVIMCGYVQVVVKNNLFEFHSLLMAKMTFTSINAKDTDVFCIYASRFARRLYLQRKCGPDHPVLNIEHQLVEMALSRLIEIVLATKANRYIVAEAIRVRAEVCVRDLVEDQDTRNSILNELAHMTHDEILPFEKPN